MGYNSTFVNGQLWCLAVTACLWIFRSLDRRAVLSVPLFQIVLQRCVGNLGRPWPVRRLCGS